jgi:hypothetical protein
MKIEDDRQDLAVVNRLDLVAIAPEAAPHAGRGPSLDLDVDQEGLPILAQERHPCQEIQLAALAFDGEELLVQEDRVPEVEVSRQVRHHEPQELGEEATEQRLEDRTEKARESFQGRRCVGGGRSFGRA